MSSPGSAFCAGSYFGIHSTPRVIAAAHKRSRSFYQKCRWRFTCKDTCTPRIYGFEYSDSGNWCMGIWCSQNVRRDGISFTWHQPCNKETALEPLQWIFKTRYVKLVSRNQIFHSAATTTQWVYTQAEKGVAGQFSEAVLHE